MLQLITVPESSGMPLVIVLCSQKSLSNATDENYNLTESRRNEPKWVTYA